MVPQFNWPALWFIPIIWKASVLISTYKFMFGWQLQSLRVRVIHEADQDCYSYQVEGNVALRPGWGNYKSGISKVEIDDAATTLNISLRCWKIKSEEQFVRVHRRSAFLSHLVLGMLLDIFACFVFPLFLLNSILLFLYACALGAVHFTLTSFASFLINYISTHPFLRVTSGRSSFITSDPYLFLQYYHPFGH